VAQPAAAVEAPGLSREAYRERFASHEDDVHAMLEDPHLVPARPPARLRSTEPDPAVDRFIG